MFQGTSLHFSCSGVFVSITLGMIFHLYRCLRSSHLWMSLKWGCGSQLLAWFFTCFTVYVSAICGCHWERGCSSRQACGSHPSIGQRWSIHFECSHPVHPWRGGCWEVHAGEGVRYVRFVAMLGWSQTQKGSKVCLFIMTRTHNMQIFWEIHITLGWSVKLPRGGEVVLKVVMGTNNKMFYDCKSPRNLTLVVCLKGVYGIPECFMPTHSFLSIHLLYCFCRCATHGNDAGSRDAARVPAGCHGNWWRRSVLCHRGPNLPQGCQWQPTGIHRQLPWHSYRSGGRTRQHASDTRHNGGQRHRSV